MALTDHPASFVPSLRAAVRGRVISREDPEYDAARTVASGDIDLYPEVIVRVTHVEDVRRVIDFARTSGLPLAVRGGGHSLAGHSLVQDGVVLDLSDLEGLVIDPDARMAWAEAGLTAADASAAAHAHGLAIPFGDTGSVGIGGLTLGGGVGFLVRKHGLTIDSLLGADVVTADGELLRADAANHPDLFWAIRGGAATSGW